jgi:ubiquinone/menaquinone biosynthesis C-methylase UbiE/GR25 family glycosyltransferase involved in LPS biosynthesis
MDFIDERDILRSVGSIALEHEHRYRFCLEIVKGKRVLDIACGEGFGSDLLASCAEIVWGVDIDHQAVEHARSTYKKENLRFSVGSCSALALPDASVDVVVSFETTEHHADHEEMMIEVKRVLRPGGVLVISSPEKRAYSDERTFNNVFHVKELYKQDFQNLLASHFQNVLMFGQRIVYGSALLQEGSGEIRSFGIGSTEPVPGLRDPVYNVAIASDDITWGTLGRGGILEESVYHSDAFVERTKNADRMIKELKDNIAKLSAEVLRLRTSQIKLLSNVRDLEKRNEKLWHNWYGSTVFRRLAFHRSGKPRGWMRALLLNDKDGTPREITRRILFKKNGAIRPSFEVWYKKVLAKNIKVSEESTNYVTFLREQIESGKLAAAQSLHIVTTPHTEFIGEAISIALQDTRLRITSSIEMPSHFNHDIYIVVAPQMFKKLPPKEKRILVQMEQVTASNWVDDAYLDLMRESLAILDYSRDNISALIRRGLTLKQIYYVPIRPIRRTEKSIKERDIDVLFYGSIASERRNRYINALSKKVRIQVDSDVFGMSLHDILARTKVVVNIHYYENALLETTRLSEALSHGTHVVSEEAIDQIDNLFFNKLVDFVPSDDVDAFVERVEVALSTWKTPVETSVDRSLSGMAFHVLRALHGVGILSLDELQKACRATEMPSERLILSLPEQVERYNFGQLHHLPGAVPFSGLRNIDGWKGCASSYKFLGSQALAVGMKRLTIYEDDATFSPETPERLSAIEAQLMARRDDWDIFSGLLSDLHSDTMITAVNRIEKEEFIDLDSVIGMVFGIYNKSALQMLSDFEFAGDDTASHTIDRYLEGLRPRTVTVFPPLVGHAEILDSTLWSISNSAASSMIEGSIARLKEKRDLYLQANRRHRSIDA